MIGTIEAANETRTSLDRAKSAILYRNMLASTEPFPVTEQVGVDSDLDGDIDYYRTEETWAHRNWQIQYDAAKVSALSWSSRAESAAQNLSRRLPALKAALQEGGFQPFLETHMNTDIDPVLHYFFDVSFFWHSFDMSKVDRIQRDVAEISGQLASLRAQVEPVYMQYRGAVDDRRREEHGELLREGQRRFGR